MADDGGMMAKTRLSQNPFAIKTSAPTRSLADSTEGKDNRPVLTPPTLKYGNDGMLPHCSSKVFLRPSALAEQAKKLAENNIGSTSKSEGETRSSEERKPEERQSDSSSISSLFSGTHREPEGVSSPASFVFGQNLHARVCVPLENRNQETPDSTVPDLSFEAAATVKNASQQSNGDVHEGENHDDECELAVSGMAGPSTSSGGSNKSLTESAEEYQSKQVKRKFSEVAVVTGEEDESNVLQINCKLFTFDKVTSTWQERGRGFLRLNDREIDGILHSRLVMRTQGSLRVVMNTKVWSSMTVDHPSQKTVRVTAMEPQGIRVFLIMANAKDTEQLFSALDWRVTMLKSREEHNSDPGGEEDSRYLQASTSSQSCDVNSEVSRGDNKSNSDENYTSCIKRWRSNESTDSNAGSSGSNVCRLPATPEDDLSSDSGFHATEDS